MNLGAPEILLILFVVIVCLLIPYWKIFGKAGFPPALSLLMLVPLVNIGLLYFFAFSPWPNLKKEEKQ